MSNRLAVAAIVLFLAACTSMKSESGLGAAKNDVVQPDVLVVQLSRIPNAARHVTGAIPIQFGVRVTNRADHPILLTRVSVASMGDGAYNLTQSAHPFKLWINPSEEGEVRFWAPASIESASIVGANGPVTVRATLTFDSNVGQFEKIVVQQVNEFGRAEVGRGGTGR
ncbi:MAG: hypothetical protein WA208_07395 [Thermoanaerobaculia bacterium]